VSKDNDNLFSPDLPPAVGVIFELVRTAGSTRDDTVGFHQSIEGAKALAKVDFDRIAEMYDSPEHDEDDVYEKWHSELVWEFKQHYWKLGSRELPHGPERWSAAGGTMTQWHIYQRDIFA
jgi:hypothetical protein